ncbi:MAG: T9SS type A sorting domain-containing protein [Cyclobacteriaceae bacterium]
MKKLILLAFIFNQLVSLAQVQLLETYSTGTKVTYYPNSCDSIIPAAEGKISFCDRAGNLGVVEKSYGLNSKVIEQMAINHYNSDEVFITSEGVSIRKEDGSWDNIPAYSAPRASHASANPPQMRDAMVTPGGKLLFYHGNMTGLQLLNLETRKFEVMPYLNDVGGTMSVYSKVFTYDPVSNLTYILAFSGTNNKYLFSYDDDITLKFLGALPSSNNNAQNTSKMFVVKDGYLFMGGSYGLYKINMSDFSDFTLYDANNLLPITHVQDFQFDENGTLWLALGNNSDGAICRMDVEDETVETYKFVSSNPSVNYRFSAVAVDKEQTIWALAANGSGFIKLTFDTDNEAQFEFFPLSYFANQGFPVVYSPGSVFYMDERVYFLTSSNSTTANDRYEGVIFDNGRWAGVNDDTPNNISGFQARRYEYGYPAEDGVWFLNRYDDGVATFWDNDGSFKKIFGVGGSQSLVVDADNKPVFNNGSTPKKIDIPLVYNFQDAQSNQMGIVRRYKDLIYTINRSNLKLLVYKNNSIVAEYQLDEPGYSNLNTFGVDSQGNPWFFRTENNDVLVKKFDIATQTTTNYPTGMGTMGGLRTLFPLPNGEMCFITSSGILLSNNGNFIRFDNSDISSLSNIIDGVSDINGKLNLFTHDNAKIVTIENPYSDEPIFDVEVLEGTSGVIPYVSFYRPGGMMLDRDGNFWGHGSGLWLKMTFDNPVPPFLNLGESYGIVGRVYLDANENNQYDPGEGYGNQRVTIVTSDNRFDTYTNQDGMYYFSYLGENTEYTITLPSVSNFVVANERQRQFTVNHMESNFTVQDFMLKSRNINSILVKSSAKTGLWGFDRNGFENGFTTAISNISFTKSFEDLELKFAFLREAEDEETPLPEIEEIKVWKITPNGTYHIIPHISINPMNHKWKLDMSPPLYNQQEVDVDTVSEEISDGLLIKFSLGLVEPLHTYVIEINTGLFSPEHTGNVMSYGVHSVKSPTFSPDPDNPSGGSTLFLIPKLQDPRTGGFDDMSPYLNPEDVYDDPPYIDPKEIYSDGPYSPKIFSSYDPNDKLVTPGLPDEINLTDINKKWLTYTLRFQNDGNFSAKDVFILDKIDENLDLNTLTLLDHSHPMQVSQIDMEDGVTIKFAFDDIYLDYSDNDLDASQGHVRFMIKAKEDIALGTIVENFGSIYFDQNPPIITNTVKNQFIELHDLGLRTNPENGGSVNINAVGEYQAGKQIVLKAQANESRDYSFVNWTRNGEVIGDSPELTYTMPASDVLLLANFERESVTLSIEIIPMEGGRAIVKLNNVVQQPPYDFEEGTELTLEAEANDRYVFVGWQEENTSYTENPLSITLETNLDLTLNFDIISNLDENELLEQSIFYPNPVEGSLYLAKSNTIKQYEIFDVQGRLMQKNAIKSEQEEISVAQLKSGFYLLKMYTDSNIIMQKFQIVR